MNGVECPGSPETTQATRAETRRLWELLPVINGYIFDTTFLVYLVLVMAEKLRAGSVSFFFDVHIILYVCVASGVLKVISLSVINRDVPVRTRPVALWERLSLPVTAGIIAGLITVRFMTGYGDYAWLAAAAAGIATGLASSLIPITSEGD